MADESKRYNLRAIRQLLLAAFNAEELHDLFYFSKTSELRDVPDQFAQGDSLPTKVRKAVRYCDSRFLLGEMLDEVKEANPRAYEKYEAMLHAPLHAPPGTGPSKARPQWLVPVLAAALVVVVIGLAIGLILLLGNAVPPTEPTPTEVARATLTRRALTNPISHTNWCSHGDRTTRTNSDAHTDAHRWAADRAAVHRRVPGH